MTTTAVTEKSRRFVRMFKPQFAELVRTGKKRQTVRPVPKRMPKVGDFIDARKWSGAPYRSKQESLGKFTCKGTATIEVYTNGIVLNGRRLEYPGEYTDNDRFAVMDGFEDFAEMRDWFTQTHGLPFSGIVIYW